MSRVPSDVLDVLERAELCHVATTTPSGPHVTPMVFTLAGDRLWVTTSRGSVKARAWSQDPRVAGVARHGSAAVAFVGDVFRHDLLVPGSWGRSVREMRTIATATVRFTRKNARFFAGYAVDAHHVPLAWTPPGRVFAELRPERTVLIGDRLVVGERGTWGAQVASHDRFRAVRTGPAPLTALPVDLREGLGSRGEGVLALRGRDGVVALPSAWVASGAGLYAVLPAQVLALAEPGGPSVDAALEIDRSSRWRARNMVGAMIRGEADVFVVSDLVTGGRSAGAVANEAGVAPEGAAVVRIRPRSIVWWRGWSSGRVPVP